MSLVEMDSNYILQNIGFVMSSDDKPFYLATQDSCVIIRSQK